MQHLAISCAMDSPLLQSDGVVRDRHKRSDALKPWFVATVITCQHSSGYNLRIAETNSNDHRQVHDRVYL